MSYPPSRQVISVSIDTKQMENSRRRKHIRKYSDSGSVSSSSSSDKSTKPVHITQESQRQRASNGNYYDKNYDNGSISYSKKKNMSLSTAKWLEWERTVNVPHWPEFA